MVLFSARGCSAHAEREAIFAFVSPPVKCNFEYDAGVAKRR
jgi:hypothetical protein